jgi:hypothetical protein
LEIGLISMRQDDPVHSSTVGWYQAWRAVATGPNGFWRRNRPTEHFRTAAVSTPIIAQSIRRLLADQPEISTVLELGAGDGRLLVELRRLEPRLQLIGIDIRPPAAELPPGLGIDWRIGEWDTDSTSWHWAQPARSGESAWPADRPIPASGEPDRLDPPDQPTMIVCAEWLDDLPCPVATLTADGWREVLVSPDGDESIGGPLDDRDCEWLSRWWPAAKPGAIAESGRTRDEAWSAVIAALRPVGGLAVMVDYGHRRSERPEGGTLTGYAEGRQVPARPSVEINLTAHVAVDAVATAGETAGAVTELLISQRDAVAQLAPEPMPGSANDTLAKLQDHGERRLLSETMGDHWWLVQRVPAASA